MGEFYFPKHKYQLIDWVKQRYMNLGQTVSGLKRLSKKQLQAIYYKEISKIKEGQRYANEQV